VTKPSTPAAPLALLVPFQRHNNRSDSNQRRQIIHCEARAQRSRAEFSVATLPTSRNIRPTRKTMRIIEPHIHCYSRTTDDYEKMTLAGIEAVIEPAFWLGGARTSVGTFVDYFDHLLGFERQRAAAYGIAHFATLSVNPREANNRAVAEQVVELLPDFLQRDGVVGLGEVGFDRNTPDEEEILRRQLRIARKLICPIIVHSPHQHKKIGVERLLAIIDEERIEHGLVDLDHCTEETMSLFAQRPRMWRGLTVYPITKLSVERAANIVQQYGVDRLLINSSADWGVSDPLSVPRVVRELERRGVPRDQIEKLVFHNPFEFYSQSPRFTFKK
jgi:predicted metal-dependent TIM-barrel fold hydrolase